MKKSFLALAVLGVFANAASAQSSVTIYGLIDEAIQKGNGGTAGTNSASAIAPLGTSKAWQVKDGSSGSRLGFRGNEDLGGGWSAQFLLEHRFNPDTGTQFDTNVFWAGGAYVQLSNASAGSVYLGRWYTPTFWIAVKGDPFLYEAGVVRFNSATLARFVTPTPTGPGVRTDNTVGYKTPNWGGFTANVATGLGEGSASNGRDDAINVEYTAGPLWVGAGYERVVGVVAAPIAGNAVDGNKLANFGVAYDFKVIRPIFYYAKSDLYTGNVGSSKVMSVGFTAPIGNGLLRALYFRTRPELSAGLPAPVVAALSPNNQQKLAVGYDYFLSKRTRVYTAVAQVREDGQTAAGAAYTNNNSYEFGVRHEF